MESESESSATAIADQPPSTPPSVSDHPISSSAASLRSSSRSNGLFGKHRLTAAIANLQNEINFLQEELEQLESLGESSAVCQELIPSVESVPDPLLPWSRGQTNESWERWFRGAHNNRKRWI